MNDVINAPSPGRTEGLVMSSPLKPTDVKRRMTFEKRRANILGKKAGYESSSSARPTKVFEYVYEA